VTRAAALRYSLAPACIAAAVLLHLSPAGPFLHPTGLFVFAVIAAAWFGGAGPGFFAAVLATFALPQLIPMSYPLVAGFFDLPRFVTFALTGLAVGWGATRRRRAEAALREVRNELEAKVTERTRAVQASEERYARVMEASDDGVWEWNPATDEMFISPRARRLFGIPDGAEVRTRADLRERGGIHPEDRPRIEQVIAASLAGRSAGFEIEYRVVDPAGEVRWIRSRGKVFPDAHGQPALLTGSLTDITERKCAELARAESEARHALAMHASGEGHWDWKIDADEFYASPRWREISGFAPDEKIGTRAQMLARYPFHPEDRPKYEAAVAAHFAGTIARVDLELRIAPHGSLRWVKFTGMCLRDAAGAPVRYAGSIMDITEQKRAEEALRESEQRYERAMAGSQAGFWDWNVPADEFYVSPKLLEMGGFAPGTRFAGRADFMQRAPFHSDDRAKWERAVKQLFAGSEARLAMELRVIVGGKARWYNLSGICIRDADGRVVRWTGSATDVSARKFAEEALRISEERYERAMEGSDAGHWDWNIVTDEMFLSARAREMLALPAGALPRRRAEIMELAPQHPDDRAAMTELVNAGIRSGIHERDYRVIPRPGEVRWLRSRGKVYTDARGAAVRMTGSLSDITERKLAVDALRESEERYARAMEATEAGHWEWDLVTHQVFHSPRFRELYGISPEEKFADRDAWKARQPVSGAERERQEQALQAAIADPAKRYDVELSFELRPGEVRWLRSRGKVFRDAHGRPLRIAGATTDITARKLAQEALRLSEERYAYAMEAAQDAHWDWIIGTDTYYTSPRVVDVFGLPPGTTFTSRQDYLDKTPLMKEDLEVWQQAALELFAGTGSRLSMELRAVINGEVRWIEHNGLCIRDASGRAVRWCGSVRDVTERRRSEEALRRSEERYALALEASAEGHFDTDLQSGEMFVSAPLNAIYGFPRRATIANRVEYLEQIPIHPDDRHLLADIIKPDWEDRARDLFDYECRIARPPGETRWIHTRGKIIRDAEGRARRRVGVVTDITERKRAAEELRESEARFRALTELSSDWYWEQDENLRFTYLSDQAGQLTGYSGESSLGKQRWEIANMAPLTCSWAEHQAVLAARQPFRDLECRRIGPDGTVRYLSMSGAPIFDAQGRFHGYRGIGRNITQRKRAEAELRESETRFRALTELSSDWYWRQDENMRFSYLSHQGLDATGLPGGEVIGRARWDFDNVKPLSGSWAEHQAVLAVRQPFRDLELVANAPDGTVSYLSISGAPIFDEQGKFGGYQGVARNITERKRIEEELRARQEMLELAQKAAQAIAFEWRLGADGPDRNRWSPELAAMYGIAPEAYDGSLEQWKKLVHPEDWPAVKEAIKHAQQTGEVSAEYRVVHPDGSVHWLHAKGRMFFDAQRNPVRMVGFMHDVTQRRHAEEELRRMERQLRQAQRLEAMGTLAGGIAHDFNNILGAILGYGEMALRDAPKGSRLARDLDSIVVAGERGRALVDRVLAFSSSGVGERVQVHVEKVVREALDLVSAKLPPSVTLHAKLHAGRAAMLGDATQVHQVLMNLATNAVQAMPAGGTLRVSLDAVRTETARAPTIGTLAPAQYVVLRVADTGTGIAPEIVDKIFDPFFTTKEVGTGTGLGLSLVHGIVAEVGGAIDVASTPGVGSTFTVYLPRSGDALESSQKEEPDLPRGDGQRVLVVDDEEPLVRLTTRTLEELGYEPTGFTSSTAALAAFRADPQRFDALITDERMPGMSGSALIREVRGIRERIPVVLMSGFVGGAVASRARAAGAEEVLKKPLSARELAASLARVLES
jgi:PAS domain S-box-containing protein